MPKITKYVIDKAEAPATGDSWIWDTELVGFGVRIQSSGRKVYVIRYRAKDEKRTQRKLTIARCSDVDTYKAREMARKELGKVAEGRDPVAEKRPKPSAPRTASIELMFKGYVAFMRGKGRVSADEVERVLLLAKNNAADALGRDRPARDITANDVVNYLAPFFQRNHRNAADKARSYIASAYAWALKAAHDYTAADRIDFHLDRNPLVDVAKDAGALNPRDRNLSVPDIRTLWNGLDSFPGAIGSCIKVLIGCGQRVKETLRIDGADIDLANRLWRMPAPKTKGKKQEHIIPLPDQVVPVLAALIEQHGDGPLFVAPNGERLTHGAVNQAIASWLSGQDAVKHFTTRDLRRTWKSRTHDAGVDRFTRDLIQQHAKSDTGSKHYDKADYTQQTREGMDKWAAWLAKALSGESTDLA